VKKKPVKREEPPAKDPAIQLRVELERPALANLLGHAAEFPDVEVCGVLVGRFQEGSVQVAAIIRGEGARERGAAVTFTNETWNHIHSELEAKFEGMQIVGWYHTHPDFDVFLSDMDTFIHTNFFGHPSHVALVRDPIRGLTAIFHKEGDEMVPLPCYWLDGKAVPLAGGAAASQGADAVLDELRDLRRLTASIQMSLYQAGRGNASNWAIVVLLALLVAVLGGQAYLGWRSMGRSQDFLERLNGFRVVVPQPEPPEAPKDKP
jgi:proteasome lid subunit RPN8/RPN11